MKKKVFVAQIPHRRDRETGAIYPSVDISPAYRHGEVVTVFPPSVSVFDLEPVIGQIQDVLYEYDYDRGDSLLAVGDPAITAVAAGILALGGPFRVLKWQRVEKEYIPVEVNL